MMNGLLAVSALGTASISVIGTIVSGVFKTTGNTVDYLWNGSTTNTHLRDYHRRIMQLDIPDKIRFIRLNVNENENDRLLDVADKIVAKLKYIESELVYHDTKWFAGYRNLAIEEDIKDLEALSTLLDNKLRFKV